jgi:hypothetical protein
MVRLFHQETDWRHGMGDIRLGLGCDVAEFIMFHNVNRTCPAPSLDAMAPRFGMDRAR